MRLRIYHVGYRSTILIAVLAFGILFSLLYSSSFLANQNKEQFYQVLTSKRADIEVYRLRAPQNICFELGDETLTRVDQSMAQEPSATRDSLSRAIKSADTDAQTDQQMEEQLLMPKEYFEQMGNRYTGEGLRVENGSAVVPLVQAYESNFNHTSTHVVKRGAADAVNRYDCNFSYGGKYYGIGIKFYSLLSLNEYSGYLPLGITDRMLKDKNQAVENVTVFRYFNNTAVWENKSNSWLTLQVTPAIEEGVSKSATESITAKLAPLQSWDLYLGGPLAEGTSFHYQIKEYPQVRGDIIVKIPPVCMDFDTARSLYSQTKFDFKTPSYVPEGYEYKCMQADMASLYLFYSNQTFRPEFMGEGPAEGQIQVYMDDYDRYFDLPDSPGVSQSDNNRIRSQYEGILKGNPTINPQLVDINGKLAWGHEAMPDGARQTVVFPDGSQIVTRSSLPARLVFYDNGTGIRLEGYVPLQELVSMAESIS